MSARQARILILIAAVIAISPASASAQEAAARPCPPACTWESTLTYSYSDLSDEMASWHNINAAAVYNFPGGAIALGAIQVSRFERWDQGVALDGYKELWQNSYGNVRVQYAPSADLLPELDLYAELFQGIPRGWEVSGSYRLRAYPDDKIHFVGASLNRYVGSWYLRGKGEVFPYADEVGVLFSVEARRYFEPPRSYLKFEAGRGRGVEVVDVGPIIETTDTYYLLAGIQKYVTSHFGLIAQAVYSDDDFFTRRTLVVGAMVRW